MRTFITYLFLALCFLCSTQAKADSYTFNSHLNSTIYIRLQQNENAKNDKINNSTKEIHLKDFLTTTDPVEDESSPTDHIFNADTFLKLLSVIYILNLFVKGLRKNHYFYTKSIQLSSCKYILLRVIRI